MILLEALNINTGGGVVLLEYLIKQFEINNIKYHVLLDDRYKKVPFFIDNCTLYRSSIFSRANIIKHGISQFKPHTLLCFGNFPPSQRYSSVRVITYFQNAHLIPNLNIYKTKLKERLVFFLKQVYLKFNLKNTNLIVFQSDFIRHEFLKDYNIEISKTRVLPFFDETRLNEISQKVDYAQEKEKAFIYTSSSSPNKNHYLLFNAWDQLIASGSFPRLYVTIEKNDVLIDRINNLNSKGADIVNLGELEHDALFEIVSKCQFTIFPTFLETIGLGLVEGAALGNKILCSDLPFIKEIVSPSLLFDPFDSKSIADSVLFAIEHNHLLPPSSIVLKNNINIFLQLLVNNEQ